MITLLMFLAFAQQPPVKTPDLLAQGKCEVVNENHECVKWATPKKKLARSLDLPAVTVQDGDVKRPSCDSLHYLVNTPKGFVCRAY